MKKWKKQKQSNLQNCIRKNWLFLEMQNFDPAGSLRFWRFWFLFFKFLIWHLQCSCFCHLSYQTSSNLSIEEGILSYDVTKPIPAPGVIRIGFGMNFSVFYTWCPKLNVSFVRRTNLHIGSKFSHSMEKNDRHFTWSLRGIVWAGLVEKKTVDFLF